MLRRLIAGFAVVLIASACTHSGPPHPRILNVWLIGGGSSIEFCPHPELMIGGVACQPLSLIASAIPRVLPTPAVSASQRCMPQYQVILNFADRSRIAYECPLPASILHLVNVMHSVLPRPAPSTQL
jgi:hypothetical protein